MTIATTAQPILQGCKTNGEKLWTVSVDEPITTEQAHHAYDLPSVGQTIRYLHGAARFPTEDTWIKAIKAGNYNTWPTITPETVRRHFPESDETQRDT